ncbi:hypothetical protein VB780_26015 [Leptolyngbya sp. CCNP1308]|uniref:hypothetical protein n=1 Tax=Leptolyngbya sp. CCNP1308 TaxID=3110255 RepID=UPI002B1FDC31|nr:hypothetical protein [Leptolyngbya sp. CCNP1308]MEA5452057.1 hypothetical protein [Leptolyngbya sp. CCNP1308]
MAMTPVKIPPTWKDDLVTLRDSLNEVQGGEVVATIATLAVTETGQELLSQLPPLTEALRANPRITLEAIAAVAEGEMLPTPANTASTALPAATIQGRAIPSALAGMVGEILELWDHNPGEAKRVLSEALSARVQPTVPIRPAGTVPVMLKNPMVDKESFQIRGGRLEFPTNTEVNVLPADLEAIEQHLASRRIDRFSPAPRSELVRC